MSPTVEVADHGDGACIGSPERKVDAWHPADRAEMGTHFLIDAILFPLSEQVQVEVAQDGGNILLSDESLIWQAIVLLCCHARPPRYVPATSAFPPLASAFRVFRVYCCFVQIVGNYNVIYLLHD